MADPPPADTDVPRERRVRAPAVPAGLAPLVAGYRWGRDLVGEAGAAVYRLHAPDRPTLYLKHGRGAVADDVFDELARLRWLGRHVAVPAVVHGTVDARGAWLLTTGLAGRTAWQWLDAEPACRAATVDLLAGFLRQLHAVPVEACPFNADHRLRMAHARTRLEAGLIDTEDFGDAHAGWSAAQLWAELERMQDFTSDRVVTHGDFSLDNILIADGRVTGCIDVGRVGIADRYQDLAIMADCLGEFDDALVTRFFAAYGIAQPDAAKLRFHLTLDECF